MENQKQTQNEAPPFFRSWNAWYALVLGFLVFLIILFYWFSISF
jgi:hypothetical protein